MSKFRKQHMPIEWHDVVDTENIQPAVEATLREKSLLVGRVGLMMLSVGTAAWRVRASMNKISRALGIVCVADIGLLSIEYTCMESGETFTNALSLSTTGINTDKLTELEARISPKTGGLDIQVLDEKTLEPVVNAVVEIKTPDGAKVEITTDQNGMINKFVEKDKNGNYTAKVGEYDITVIKVPEGYSVTTGQTKTETVVEGEVKHHVAKIATAKNSTDTDTTNKNNTNKDTNKNNNTTVNNNKNSTKKTDTNAKTADEADVAGVAGLMIISLAAVAVIVRRKKEDEE